MMPSHGAVIVGKNNASPTPTPYWQHQAGNATGVKAYAHETAAKDFDWQSIPLPTTDLNGTGTGTKVATAVSAGAVGYAAVWNADGDLEGAVNGAIVDNTCAGGDCFSLFGEAFDTVGSGTTSGLYAYAELDGSGDGGVVVGTSGTAASKIGATATNGTLTGAFGHTLVGHDGITASIGGTFYPATYCSGSPATCDFSVPGGRSPVPTEISANVITNESTTSTRSIGLLTGNGCVPSSGHFSWYSCSGFGGYHLGNFEFGGYVLAPSLRLGVTNVSSSPYTVAATDGLITCDATGGARTINLPAATGTGRYIVVKKTDSSSNACTPTRAGSDTIDGATTVSLATQYDLAQLVDTASGKWSALLAPKGSAGSCGSATTSCALTFDAYGHETARADVAITATGGSSGQIVGTLSPDPNFSTTSLYGRSGGYYCPGCYLELKPQPTWIETIADAKTNPPGGWAIAGTSSNLLAADENTTTANGLFISGITSGTYATLATEPGFQKDYSPNAIGGHTFIYRISTANIDTTSKYCIGLIVNAADATKFEYVGFKNVGGASAGLIGGSNAGETAATCDATCAANGVWFRIDQWTGNTVYYNTVNQSTPPSTWTSLHTASTTSLNPGQTLRFRFHLVRSTAVAGNVSCSILYFDDQNVLNPTTIDNVAFTNTGTDNTNAAVQLVTDRIIGASTTLTDANLRSTLTEAINRRPGEAGAWTFCSLRGSSTPSVGSCSFAAAASATTATSGDSSHWSLWAKCNATRAQTCSLFLPAMRFPID
jgi:hypothetical protein